MFVWLWGGEVECKWESPAEASNAMQDARGTKGGLTDGAFEELMKV